MAGYEKIDFHTELEIKCLTFDRAVCVYRQILRDHFGYHDLNIECPFRKILKLEFEKYERDQYHARIDHIYDGR